MTDWMIRVQLWFWGHRRAVLVAVLLWVALGLFWIPRLQMDQDYTTMLPMSDPAIAEQVQALQRIRQADRLFLDVQSRTANPELLRQAADRMEAALQNLPELSDIRGNFQGADLGGVLAQMRAQLPGLLSAEDLEQLAGRLQPAAIDRRLRWLKQALSQPQGFLLAQAARADPIGWIDGLADRIRALQAGTDAARLVNGRITSSDGRHVLLSALPVFPPSDLDRSASMLARVLQAAREVEAQFEPGSVHIAVSGAHRMTLDNATLIRADSTRTSLVAIVAIAVLLLAAHRRPWLALLGLAPTAFGLLSALLLFALTREPVVAAALGFGSILIGVTVDYGIYLLYTADDSMPGDPPQRARMVTQLAAPVTFGALTTMAAFWVMFLSPMRGHRQLAAYGAAGVALAALFALFVLPLFIGIGPGRAPAGSGLTPRRGLPLTLLMERLFAWRQRLHRVLVPGGILFSLFCLVGIFQLRFEGDLARLNGVTEDTQQDEAILQSVWGRALSLTTVVVSGGDWEEVLDKNGRIYALLQGLRRDGLVDTVSSIAPLFPDRETRQANRRDWASFWTAERRQGLSNNLSRVATDLGFRMAAFQPFLDGLRPSPTEASSVGPAQTPLGEMLNDYWLDKKGRLSIATRVKVEGDEKYQQLRAAVHETVPDARLLNKGAMAEEIARIARRALPVFAVLVVVLNAGLLFLLLGRLELVWITLLPMGTGVFWTLGTLGFLGLPIDLSNFIFVVFVVGVGGDYSLFLVAAELEPLRGHARRSASTGGAVTVSALTTLLGVGTLVMARHPALQSVGLTALLGISFSLMATLLLVPACMDRVRRWSPRLKPAESWNLAGRPSRWELRNQVRQIYRYQGPYVTQFIYWKTRLDPLCHAVDTALPRRGTVLDLGCGYGFVAHWLTLAAPERTVIGVDHDAGKIRVAQATACHNPKVTFIEANVLAWPYPPCDHVILCDLLHYFPRELKLQILRNACAAMRPGGRLVLRDACGEKATGHRAVVWAERWAVWAGLNKTDQGLHFEDLSSHLDLLRQAGLEPLQTIQDAGLGSNLLIVAGKEMESPPDEPARIGVDQA